MTIRIDITGLEALRSSFTNLDQQFNDAVQNAIISTVTIIKARVQEGINRGPKSGKVYEKSNPRRVHQASAPGEAPASDTGRLAASIYIDIDPFAATVGSRLVYARYLEYGTRKMAPRPIWVPVALQEEKKIPARIQRNLAKVTR